MKSYIQLVFVLLLFIFSPLFFSCKKNVSQSEKNITEHVFDLAEIEERGKLIVVTDFNSVNYFIYKGQPQGFQYELLQELSDYLGLPLEVKVNNDLNKNFDMLLAGEVDLIASNLTITRSRKDQADFTIPHSQTRQVLVQKINRNNELIRNPLDLGGKMIYVQKGSVYAERLHNLSEEIGDNILITEIPLSSEQLIKMVAKGEIDYTIADENIAEVNLKIYPFLDISTPVSFEQNQAWALRRESPELKYAIDVWLNDFKKTAKYAVLYNKYFRSGRTVAVVNSKFYYPETGRISYFDEILKRESKKLGWDWRLLSSMIYRESRFNHDAVSRAGAFGIMQFMPETASIYGIDEQSSAEEQILAGIRYIRWLDKLFISLVPDETERIKFVLGSYNIGPGHVLDAIRLAKKYNRNPEIWEDNVEFYLLKKSEPLFYNDEVVKNGYCKGSETYHYVRNILYLYNLYRNIEIPVIAQLHSEDQ